MLLLLDSDIAWLRCVAMNLGSVIVESKDLETHLNRIKDFTGIRLRMSYTMSFRRHCCFSITELERIADLGFLC